VGIGERAATPAISCSPMVQGLRGSGYKLEAAIARIQDLMNRLEL
jgi:hypothetical protein